MEGFDSRHKVELAHHWSNVLYHGLFNTDTFTAFLSSGVRAQLRSPPIRMFSVEKFFKEEFSFVKKAF